MLNQTSILRDRTHAGCLLAQRLAAQHSWPPDTIVLALPRGGVVVGYEIARTLALPLDICLVRKLGVHWHPELAMGAIAGDGVIVLQDDVIQDLRICEAAIHREIALEREEINRRDKLYRGGRPHPELSGKAVIIVDDRIATGSSVEAAIKAIRKQGARRIVVAVGVAPPSTSVRLGAEGAEVVAILEPEWLRSIGEWFEDFTQVTDEEVRGLLEKSDANLLSARR